MRRTDLKKEREYADEIPEEEGSESPEPYEETYRDGSAKNECWRDEDRYSRSERGEY